MEESYKIPGIDWEGLSLLQSKRNQNFVCQELARYKSKEKYLARLQYLQLQPVPTQEKFNKHDPCDQCEMLKISWNDKEKCQQNGHYNLTTNQNYNQMIRVVLKCTEMIPIELHVEVINASSTTTETGRYNIPK